MDYVGASKLDPEAFRDVIAGLCSAAENGAPCSAERRRKCPASIRGEYDLVGTIVGKVARKD